MISSFPDICQQPLYFFPRTFPSWRLLALRSTLALGEVFEVVAAWVVMVLAEERWHPGVWMVEWDKPRYPGAYYLELCSVPIALTLVWWMNHL